MAKEIGPKEKALRAMREARVAAQRAANASSADEKPKVVKRRPKPSS